LKLHAVDNPFPEFAVPEGHTIDSYFEQVCRKAIKNGSNTAIAHWGARCAEGGGA